MKKNKPDDKTSGKLKIGDHWNAITIIALSQNNPLKAIAEFVENSIDARAKSISIIKGKIRNEHYIKVIDDGEGISDFTYLATHIGDSIKRKLKKEGIKGIQGEFGIGLLSFWTVGEELLITSCGKSGETFRMKLVKNNQGYSISKVNSLFNKTGTELYIKPLLSGLRQLNGEKIQNYLASELRDRIAKNNVEIRIIDRSSRKELLVEPRKFSGRLLHNLPEIRNPLGDIYYELYINKQSQANQISIYKQGTRVFSSITDIEHFKGMPWDSGYLEGIIDIPFLQLTPGTRDGIIYDDAFDSFLSSIDPLSEKLNAIIKEQKKAEEEEASQSMLKKIRKALKEAFLMLPDDIYDWLDIQGRSKSNEAGSNGAHISLSDQKNSGNTSGTEGDNAEGIKESASSGEQSQKAFFEFPGPLYKAVISPFKAVMGVNEAKKFNVIARDKNKRRIDSNLSIKWIIKEGEGLIDDCEKEIIEFKSPAEPCLTVLEASVMQDGNIAAAECYITVTEEFLAIAKDKGSLKNAKGLPGYTYRKAPGETWRSKFDQDNYIIIINNAHPDFIFVNKNNSKKIKYIANLFVKELVLTNFPSASKSELLERLIELNLYMEDNLK